MHDGRGNYYYQAECYCGSMNCGRTSEEAYYNHYIHSAKKHSYILPEDFGNIAVHDKTLQHTITLAMLYGLPMPEYEDHEQCIKQMLNDVVVCVRHKGNEPKVWLGYL